MLIQATPPEQQKKLIHHIELMQSSLLGTYTLIDYLHFKGSGLNPREKSNGQQWGLLQVLLDMLDEVTVDTITKAFTVSAAKKLLMLIQNSAPEYSRIRFLAGWMKRISTYA